MVEDIFIEIAVAVFSLLAIGIGLTIHEFKTSINPKDEDDAD